MALLSGGNAKAGKAKAKHGALLPVKNALHSTVGAKATAADAKATAAKAGLKSSSAFTNALLKALEKNTAAARTHADGLHVNGLGPNGLHGAAARFASGRKEAADAHKLALAHLPGCEQAGQQQANAVKAFRETDEEQGHDEKKLKKKTARTPVHTDGIASAVGIGLAQGTTNIPRPERSKGEAVKGPAEHVAAVSPPAARKGHELRLHVVDARRKPADSPVEDTAGKALKTTLPDRDASAPVVPRDSGAADTSVREMRRQSAPPPAPAAGALERLREMAGSELTRAAGIILRDGGGEIKLTLKPESLGSVRIRMNLVDNAIEGRIIVDNTAVKHVFEGSLDSLMRALTAEGFQTASLQVSVGGQGSDNGRPDKEPSQRIRRVNGPAGPAGPDWNVPGVESMSLGDLLVNLFV